MTGAERGGRRAGSRAGGEIMDAGAVSLPARAACRGRLQGPPAGAADPDAEPGRGNTAASCSLWGFFHLQMLFPFPNPIIM